MIERGGWRGWRMDLMDGMDDMDAMDGRRRKRAGAFPITQHPFPIPRFTVTLSRPKLKLTGGCPIPVPWEGGFDQAASRWT